MGITSNTAFPRKRPPVSRRSLLRLLIVGAAASSLTACGTSTASVITPTPSTVTSNSTVASSSTFSTSANAVKVTSTSKAAAATKGPNPTPTPAAGETHQGAATTIDLWYGWSGVPQIATWKALTPKMAEALPGFNVHWIVADNSTKLLTAIAGGSPPGVAVGNIPYPEFYARGAAQPLDSYIARSKEMADIPAAFWGYASYRGKRYAVPALQAGPAYALVLNADNLHRVGINPSTLSWDWDTLARLQQQLTKKAANGSIAVLGIDPLDAMGGPSAAVILSTGQTPGTSPTSMNTAGRSTSPMSSLRRRC